MASSKPAYEVRIVDVAPRLMAAGKSWANMSDVGPKIVAALDRAYQFVHDNKIPFDQQEKAVIYRMEKGASFEKDGCAIFCGPFVPAPFEGREDVVLDKTPGGKAVTVRHIGCYTGIHLAHAAVHEWNEANGKQVNGLCWDVYGEGNEDPDKLVTDIYYQLA